MQRRPLGGVIHTYQKYNPRDFPSPTQEPPDLVSSAFDHMLQFGSMRELTEEELAKAIRIDPSQIGKLGPSLDALRQMLEDRKRKILETYETKKVQKKAKNKFHQEAKELRPPRELKKAYKRAVQEEQIYDLEQIWYRSERDAPDFSRGILQLMTDLGNLYQVDELAANYFFTGNQSMTIPEALQIKEELEKIDELLKQLEEAAETAQIGIIDMDMLSEFAEPSDIDELSELQQQVQNYLREIAEQQGLEQKDGQYQLTPKAMRVFQGHLLQEIFSEMQSSRSGRHEGPIVGEGAVEMQETKEYEFGDSIAHLDMPASMVNALLRNGPGLPVRMKSEDMVVHRTRNHPKCATTVLLDMSGSMRYGGLYMHVKRMGIALDGLIRREYPGDFLQFIEIYSLPKPRHISELPELMPKMVTLFDPWVRIKADMSRPDVSEAMIPPHFTNIQRAMQMGRQYLTNQDTPNRQMVLITDGLPTAHFEGETLFLLYPPDPQTEEATMREARMCAKEGITINLFLLQTWNQSEEDVRFAYRLAETTQGRVFFCAGQNLDRFVLHDYVNRRKRIIS
ncbi:Long form Mg-chelase associated protein with vWA domain [Planctomycetales bacterium 10988]|nr:Long form Mg-chelase associated protein with vWA domain [Planctomycetales bacterium 10988]